jgi:hypothetical protein
MLVKDNLVNPKIGAKMKTKSLISNCSSGLLTKKVVAKVDIFIYLSVLFYQIGTSSSQIPYG